MKKIGLDPGHAIYTQGKGIPNIYLEAEFTHWIVRKLAYDLKNTYEIYITKDLCSPVDLTYTERKNLLIAQNCDLTLSVHSNACDKPEIHAPLFMANKNEPESIIFGRLLEEEFNKIYPYGECGSWHDGSTTQSLCNTQTTSAIIECAFHTNKLDLELLKSTEYRLNCVAAIEKAIAKYFELDTKCYFEFEGSHVIECNPQDLQCNYASGVLPKTYVNGAFYSFRSGKLFHSMVSGGNIIETRKEYSVYPTGTFKIMNGKVSIKTEKNFTYDGVDFLINGVNLDYEENGSHNLNESCVNEHTGLDVLRYTNHTALGYNPKNDKAYMVVTKPMVGDDVRKLMRKLGCIDENNDSNAILLDGGNSSKMVYNGEIKHDTTRQLNNIIYI